MIPGQPTGHIALSRCWHGIGRPDREPTPSASLLHKGQDYIASTRVIRDMNLLSHRVNELLRCLDPTFHQHLQTLRDHLKAEPGLAALESIDPLLMEGREFLFNTKMGVHMDRYDPKLGWAVLVALGSFKGGYLSLPQLRYRVRLEPGDIILLRGRVVKHSIESFTGGPRINVPHFTHTSLWNKYGIAHLVNP